MARDYANDSTFTSLFAGKSQATNNTASAGVDLRGYEGTLAARVNFGIQTAGDNGATHAVIFQSAANNTASEATNIGTLNVTSSTNNNASSSGNVQIDPRSCYRYLFGRIIITGANSPARPLSVEVVGQKQVQ